MPDYQESPELLALHDQATEIVKQFIQKIYTEIERVLIARLKLRGFEINEETAKRVTRIDKSTIAQQKQEFWLDYDTINRQFLFLFYIDEGMICYEFAERKPIGGVPFKSGEVIIKKKAP